MKVLISALLLTLLLASGAWTAPQHLSTYLDNPREVGTGKLTFMFWHVYTATLFAPSGTWAADAPFALHIVYHMDIEGEDITSRSLQEMQRQGLEDPETLRRFGAWMTAIFSDVTDGTTLTGIRDRAGGTLFYKDGTYIGAVRDTEFTQRFFAIWLAPDTSEPSLRRRLLGEM